MDYRTYIPPKIKPHCKYCGKPVKYYYFGLPLHEHFHNECHVEQAVETMLEGWTEAVDRAFESTPTEG